MHLSKQTRYSLLLTWHGLFKDLPRKTASDKVLRDKAFNIAKNPKYVEHQCGLAGVIYKFFDKMSSGCDARRTDKSAIKTEIMSNQQLVEELHKLTIRKLEKLKVQSSFKDYLWCWSCGYAINK